jgi:hypothetical protein
VTRGGSAKGSLSRDLQKAEEKIAGDFLVSKLADLAGATVESHERPDLLVHLGQNTYGLEATAIVRAGDDGIPLKARAQWTLKVEQRAEQLCREYGLPINVALWWVANPPIASYQHVAGWLVGAVQEQLRRFPASGRVLVEVRGYDLPPELQPHISRMNVYRSPKGTANGWASGWANLPDVQPSELQAEIDRKSAIASSYQSKHDLWLLIYATGRNAAESLDLNESARESAYRGGVFRRVFFIDARAEAAELRVLAQP